MIREDTKKRAKCQVYLSIFQRAHSFGPLKAPSSQPTLSYRVGAEIKNELTHERARVKLAWTLLASEKEENEVKKRARKQIYLQFLSASTEHLAAKPFRHLVHVYWLQKRGRDTTPSFLYFYWSQNQVILSPPFCCPWCRCPCLVLKNKA